MPAPAAALTHYRRQQAITARAVALAAALWGRVDPDALAESWAVLAGALWRVVASSQIAAASLASGYVDDVLDEQGIGRDAQGRVRPSSVAGVASDGRELSALLYSPLAQARQARYGGGSTAQAVRVGREALSRIVATQVQDAGRVAVGVEAFARPAVTGYVRQLNLPSCSRCIVLAGKWFRSNEGFERHPKCDCVHIPTREDIAGDVQTSPRAAFGSLSPEEQDRIFTADGARAIRDGADLGQVVNARRGMRTASVFGERLAVTTEGTTVRGVAGRALGGAARARGARYRSATAPRLMPEAIYELAGDDRAEAIRLLRRYGYLT
jgi:hypothetical protein